MKAYAVKLAFVSALALGLVSLAGDAPAGHITCGTVIAASGVYVLDSNVGPCAGDGVIITASGVELDLDNKSIKGGSTGAGVKIVDADDVHVHNGNITGFFRGIDAKVTNDSTFEDLKVSKSREDGVRVEGSGNTYVNVRSDKHVGDGFNVKDNGSDFLENRASKNGGNGMKVQGSGNSLEDNSAKNNGKKCIFVEGGGNSDDGGNKGSKGCDCTIDGVPCI